MLDTHCYKLVRNFICVCGHASNDSEHHNLVIWRNYSVVLQKLFFPLSNARDRRTNTLTSNDKQNVEPHVSQGFEIAGIRTALVPFVASLRIPGDTSDLGHLFLFKPQSDPFFTQAFARSHLRIFCL